MIQKRDVEKLSSHVCLPVSLHLAALFLFCLAIPSVSHAQDAGVCWAQATSAAAFGPRFDHSSVAYDGRIWVVGGYSGSAFLNDVWYSPDGANWTRATANAAFSARCDFTMAVFNGKMWVIGGSGGGAKNDVWYSTDGVNWTRATASAAFPARWDHTTVVYDNKMWVIGGFSGSSYLNDVWYSSDGATWTRATAGAAFSPRELPQSLVYNGLMWVIGGGNYNGSPLYNDVWYSSDGATWTRATASAGFSPRVGHMAAVYNNQMWVIAGTNTSSNFNDVWASSNGVTWTRLTASANFGTRDMHSVVVFDNKVWVIAGETYANRYLKSDVWYTPCSAQPVTTPAAVLTSTFSFTPTATKTSTPTPTLTSTLTPVLTATLTATPLATSTWTPVLAVTCTPVTQYGCFAGSGDGLDRIIADPNPEKIGTNGVIVPAIPWPAACGGEWISDNPGGFSPLDTPTTIVFQKTFTLSSEMINTGSFSVSFGADDEVIFAVSNAAHPSGVTIASCMAPVGSQECQGCHGQAFDGTFLAAGAPNTLTVTLINTVTAPATGDNFGYSGVNYQICVAPRASTPTLTSTPLPPTATCTATPSVTSTWTPEAPLPTATFTPTSVFTNSPIPLFTQTPTFTNTPDHKCKHGKGGPAILYPNPITGHGPCKIHLCGDIHSPVKVKILTSCFREVQEKTFDQVSRDGDLFLDLVDTRNTCLANGVYYVVIQANYWTSKQKLLILK
jgi:hypothetical protein